MSFWQSLAGGYCDVVDSMTGQNANFGECDITRGQQQEAYETDNPYAKDYGSGFDLFGLGKLKNTILLIGGLILAINLTK